MRRVNLGSQRKSTQCTIKSDKNGEAIVPTRAGARLFEPTCSHTQRYFLVGRSTTGLLVGFGRTADASRRMGIGRAWRTSDAEVGTTSRGDLFGRQNDPRSRSRRLFGSLHSLHQLVCCTEFGVFQSIRMRKNSLVAPVLRRHPRLVSQ